MNEDHWEPGRHHEYSWATPIDVSTFQSAVPTVHGRFEDGPRKSGRGKQILRIKEEDYYMNHGRKLTQELRNVLGHGMSNYEIERHWGHFDDADPGSTTSEIEDSLSSMSMSSSWSSASFPSASSELPPATSERKPLTFKDLDKPPEENPLQKFKEAMENYTRSSAPKPPEESQPKVRNVVVASLQNGKGPGRQRKKKKFHPLKYEEGSQVKPEVARRSLPRPVFTLGFSDLPDLSDNHFPPLK